MVSVAKWFPKSKDEIQVDQICELLNYVPKLIVHSQSVQISSVQFSPVQFSHSVVSDSLRRHESQHARPPCPSPSPRVHSDSRPPSHWCHPAISSSVIPFSSCLQSLPASQSFPMSQLFAWGGQSIGVSALASFLPKNTQDWSLLEWTGWISLQSKGLFKHHTPQHHSLVLWDWKASILCAQHSLWSNFQIRIWFLEKL